MTETTDAGAIVAPLWRFKWLILLVGLLVAAGTYAYYSGGTRSYVTITEINLNNGNEEQGIQPAAEKRTGKKKGNASAGSTAVSIISSPLVHGIVAAELRAMSTHVAQLALRGSVAASAKEKSQFVTISATAKNPRSAALLANLTAQVYVARDNENFARGIRKSLTVTRSQLNSIEVALAGGQVSGGPVATGKKGKRPLRGNATSQTLQAASLQNQINQLEQQLAIQQVKQVGVANPRGATVIQSSPKENAIFGFVIGIFLAAIAAYTLNRFDKRIRTLDGVERTFGVQVLAALPTVRRPIARRNGELTPSKSLNEPLRRLQTALTLGPALNGRGARPRSVLFLSPDAADGKSTLAASLALIQRAAGERVSLIEADFRRPVLGRVLDMPLRGGLLEVLTGSLTLDEALQPVEPALQEPAEVQPPNGHGAVATLARPQSIGTLSVLLGDSAVPNPPALLAEPAMAALVHSAREEFDHVLIDAPPPLMVSDAMALLSIVDGIVLVARIGHTREASAARLMDLLARSQSAPILGVVANDVSRTDMERYGFSLGYGRRGWVGRILGR